MEIGFGGDPEKHATWQLRGSISADCCDAAVNLTSEETEVSKTPSIAPNVADIANY